MSNQYEVSEKNNMESCQQEKFDYPFYKVNIVLFKEAVEDLVLPNICKRNTKSEN
ncbi:MAG: hypothetical protein N3A59_01445 [Thermodesulfovibrionales bacterium]|nr:hypothetical protein [Thermodesulfovibrionales bacterium]